MGIEIDPAGVRRLNTGTFTGDTWAVQATMEVPPADVPRFAATSSAIRWSVVGMDGGGNPAEQAADDVTEIEARIIKLAQTDMGNGLVRTVVSTSGTIVGQELTDLDISPGDVFVLAVPSITTDVGSAPWLWVVLHAGANVLPGGASP